MQRHMNGCKMKEWNRWFVRQNCWKGIIMNPEITSYLASLSENDRQICQKLMDAIEQFLPHAMGKVWHGSPVWFIDENPDRRLQQTQEPCPTAWAGNRLTKRVYPRRKTQGGRSAIYQCNRDWSCSVGNLAQQSRWDSMGLQEHRQAQRGTPPLKVDGRKGLRLLQLHN